MSRLTRYRDWITGGKSCLSGPFLACDDGLRNVLTDMTPILREEGVSCLFFVLGASAAESSQMLWYEELCLCYRQRLVGTMLSTGRAMGRRSPWIWEIGRRGDPRGGAW